MATIACIPARLESTRLPQKLLRKVGGKTVLWWTVQRVCDSKLFDAVYVIVDTPQLTNALPAQVHCIVENRTCCSGTDRISLAASQLPPEADWIVNIQGDEPMITNETLAAIVQPVSTPMATCVAPITPQEAQSPHRVKCVFDQQSKALYFSRAPIPYGAKTQYGHCGIYGFEPKLLKKWHTLRATPLQKSENLEQLKALEHGYAIHVHTVTHAYRGIDTAEDLAFFQEYCRG